MTIYKKIYTITIINYTEFIKLSSLIAWYKFNFILELLIKILLDYKKFRSRLFDNLANKQIIFYQIRVLESVPHLYLSAFVRCYFHP